MTTALYPTCISSFHISTATLHTAASSAAGLSAKSLNHFKHQVSIVHSHMYSEGSFLTVGAASTDTDRTQGSSNSTNGITGLINTVMIAILEYNR